MKIDLYERIWMIGVSVMLVAFFGTLANASLRHGLVPPSHIETINPRAVFSNPGFRTQGVSVGADGRIQVAIVGLTFAWMPAELTLPAGRPITFRLTSPDVVHGFQIVRSNGQAMVIPGYVSQFTTQFDPGEYLVVCNEYCGLGHHQMAGKLTVVPGDQWQPPARVMGSTAGEAREAQHAAH